MHSWLFSLLSLGVLASSVAAWIACAPPKFSNRSSGRDPAQVDPVIDPVADPDRDGSAGGDDDGTDEDPPSSDADPTSLPEGYPPGSQPPTTGSEPNNPPPIPTPDSTPSTTPGTESSFIKCKDGRDREAFPIYAKVYEFGKQDAYTNSVESPYVLASAYYGFNGMPVPNNDPKVPPLADALKPYQLVKEAMVDLRGHEERDEAMQFLYKFFKNDRIEEGAGQNHVDRFNYRDEFCMKQFNVPNQTWTGGFPAVRLREWFTLRAASYFAPPAGGEYEFLLRSDDGAVFQLIEQKADGSFAEIFALSTDGVHSAEDGSAKVTLAKSRKYLMHMRYFQGPRERIALQLFWRKPGAAADAWELVPTSAFKYEDKWINAGAHRPY